MGTERSGGRSLAARGMISTCLTLNSSTVRLIGAEVSPAHFSFHAPRELPKSKFSLEMGSFASDGLGKIFRQRPAVDFPRKNGGFGRF